MLDPTGSGLRLTVSTDLARFNEIWLVEALKAIWEIWTRVGWQTENIVDLDDWARFVIPTEIQKAVGDITRFNVLTQNPNFDFEKNFDEGWRLIIQIAQDLDANQIGLKEAPETCCFRNKVAAFIMAGIKRGLVSKDPSPKEQVIYPIHAAFYEEPVHGLIDFEAGILTNPTETTVTLQAPVHIINSLKYECLPIFVSL